MKRFLTLLALAVPTLGGCGGDERPATDARAQAEPRPETAVVTDSERLPSDLPGRIAFQSDRTGHAKIFVLDHDGVRQITHGPGNDRNPKWSPDGKQIVFSSDRDGNEEIYVIGADGNGLRRLTDHPSDDRNPAWSPDGSNLVFDTQRWGPPTLWVMPADGGDRRRVTRTLGRWEAIPAWSPDGDWFAYSTRRLGGSWRVAAVRTDGTGERIVASARGDCRPDFSPDGTTVAFVSTRADHRGDIWTVPFAGGEPRRLTTTDTLYDYHPNWSPDGRHIALAAGSKKEQGYNLFVVTPDGSDRLQLTFGSSHDAHPSWGQ